MNIVFAGLKTTGKVEMVWCILDLGNSQRSRFFHDYLIIWGRRHGKLQHVVRQAQPEFTLPDKIYDPVFIEGLWTTYQLFTDKINAPLCGKICKMIIDGYKPIQVTSLDEIDPNIEKRLERIELIQIIKKYD